MTCGSATHLVYSDNGYDGRICHGKQLNPEE